MDDEISPQGKFPRRWPKISQIHRDLLGPVKMASFISTSNQVSGTRAHKLLSIREYQQRRSLWPGLEPKSDMYCLWTIPTFFYTQGLNTTPEPWPESGTDLLSKRSGNQGLSCSCLYFAGMQDQCYKLEIFPKQQANYFYIPGEPMQKWCGPPDLTEDEWMVKTRKNPLNKGPRRLPLPTPNLVIWRF